MKRLFDTCLIILTAPLWMPLLFIFCLLSLYHHGWPILFTQDRGGKNGSVFKLFKLRTMTNDCDETGKLLPDAARITAFGRLCRKCSMDELPSLLNVLKGDMSLVGPRPFLADYLPLYSPFQSRRHEVKPGITGWAQINGRNTISWDEKFLLDIWYVENQTFLLDLKILVKTVYKILKKEGISQEGHVTMPVFDGKN